MPAAAPSIIDKHNILSTASLKVHIRVSVGCCSTTRMCLVSSATSSWRKPGAAASGSIPTRTTCSKRKPLFNMRRRFSESTCGPYSVANAAALALSPGLSLSAPTTRNARCSQMSQECTNSSK